MDLPKSKIDNKITETQITSQNDQVNSVVVNFTDVQLAYSKQVVLRDINLRIFKSEFVYVIKFTFKKHFCRCRNNIWLING